MSVRAKVRKPRESIARAAAIQSGTITAALNRAPRRRLMFADVVEPPGAMCLAALLGRALVAAQSDSRDTNRQTNHTRPESEESKEAGTDGIRIGIGPQPDRSGHDDEDQRPAAKDEETEADANPAGLQIFSHVVSAVRASA